MSAQSDEIEAIKAELQRVEGMDEQQSMASLPSPFMNFDMSTSQADDFASLLDVSTPTHMDCDLSLPGLGGDMDPLADLASDKDPFLPSPVSSPSREYAASSGLGLSIAERVALEANTDVTQTLVSNVEHGETEFLCPADSPHSLASEDSGHASESSSAPSSSSFAMSLSPRPASSVCSTFDINDEPPTKKPFAERSKPAQYKNFSDLERRMIEEEGFVFPESGTLTKGEEKRLKAIRRKIKNKLSAQESRIRKKQYLEGLERRVQETTEQNTHLKSKVTTLETENKTLASQLRALQERLLEFTRNGRVKGSTALMILCMSFALCMTPMMMSGSGATSSSSAAMGASPAFVSRTLKGFDMPEPEAKSWARQFFEQFSGTFDDEDDMTSGSDHAQFGARAALEKLRESLRLNTMDDADMDDDDDDEEDDEYVGQLTGTFNEADIEAHHQKLDQAREEERTQNTADANVASAAAPASSTPADLHTDFGHRMIKPQTFDINEDELNEDTVVMAASYNPDQNRSMDIDEGVIDATAPSIVLDTATGRDSKAHVASAAIASSSGGSLDLLESLTATAASSKGHHHQRYEALRSVAVES